VVGPTHRVLAHLGLRVDENGVGVDATGQRALGLAAAEQHGTTPAACSTNRRIVPSSTPRRVGGGKRAGCGRGSFLLSAAPGERWSPLRAPWQRDAAPGNLRRHAESLCSRMATLARGLSALGHTAAQAPLRRGAGAGQVKLAPDRLLLLLLAFIPLAAVGE